MRTNNFVLPMKTMSSDKLMSIKKKKNLIATSVIVLHISTEHCYLQNPFINVIIQSSTVERDWPRKLNDIIRVSLQVHGKGVLCEFYLKGSELMLIKLKGFTYFFSCIMCLESCSYHGWQAEQILTAQFRNKESKA